MTLRVRSGAIVKRSPTRLKVQGSNLGWDGLNLKQMLKPDPIDKTSPWWRNGKAFSKQNDEPGFESRQEWLPSQMA